MEKPNGFTPLFNTSREAAHYQRSSGVLLVLLYLHLGTVIANWLPAWSLCLSIPILVVRWMLAIHELFHLRTEKEVDPLSRLMPLLLTPLSIGYREHLLMHNGHHHHMATPEDPEYFQLRGNRFVGFLNALTAPEQAFIRWAAAHGLDRELALGALVRLGLFAALVLASGPLFAWYWLTVRLSHALSFFSFFYLLHRRGPDFGVYRVTLPSGAARLYQTLFGADNLTAITHHDLHHRHPRVAARHLPDIA